jgi:hypothetical protein
VLKKVTIEVGSEDEGEKERSMADDPNSLWNPAQCAIS